MEKIFEVSLSYLQDPRSLRNQKHPFITIIVTTIFSYLAGIESFSGISEFVESKLEELSEYLPFPSQPRYLSALLGCPRPGTNSLSILLAEIQENIISVDGKTIRNSGKTKPLHIVSAWSDANKLVLAQTKVDGKTNEIKAIPILLRLLDLKNRTVCCGGTKGDL